MKTVLCLAKMESRGMNVKKANLQRLVDLLKVHQAAIEKKAYSLAGRRFNFVSPSDVARVIGMSREKRISTKKHVLEKSEHPISNMVLQWRKINFTLSKVIFPLIRAVQNDKIRGCYHTHTATGRISMHEPNMQMVTKDFEVLNPLTQENVKISCRSAFRAPDGWTLISADYCQLELRILTYLSCDKHLTNIMKNDGDVFKSIAAKWNNVAEDMVDENMRQTTKQLCYGILYGMGAKALSEQLNILENEASKFIEIFKNAYPGIKDFFQKTIENCKLNGYVETITGRRRYLPNINKSDISLKSQAERQAINTTIQGSAADIVKNAMISIEHKICEVFKKSRHKPILTLHLHDELIYETLEKYIEKTARIVKTCMENSARDFGNFTVKVKVGKSWGELAEYSVTKNGKN
ncbi:DNA polymerase theta isoform X6 [Cylas formicarius]|nr:DNA polymerase theta isoform X6 [Cylas formicarius]